MKRKSRDWDLTLELPCHADFPTVNGRRTPKAHIAFRRILKIYNVYNNAVDCKWHYDL
jgi:hypothetical protein